MVRHLWSAMLCLPAFFWVSGVQAVDTSACRLDGGQYECTGPVYDDWVYYHDAAGACPGAPATGPFASAGGAVKDAVERVVCEYAACSETHTSGEWGNRRYGLGVLYAESFPLNFDLVVASHITRYYQSTNFCAVSSTLTPIQVRRTRNIWCPAGYSRWYNGTTNTFDFCYRPVDGRCSGKAPA